MNSAVNSGDSIGDVSGGTGRFWVPYAPIAAALRSPTVEVSVRQTARLANTGPRSRRGFRQAQIGYSNKRTTLRSSSRARRTRRNEASWSVLPSLLQVTRTASGAALARAAPIVAMASFSWIPSRFPSVPSGRSIKQMRLGSRPRFRVAVIASVRRRATISAREKTGWEGCDAPPSVTNAT